MGAGGGPARAGQENEKPMKSISRLETNRLSWVPVGRRSYQLQAGDELVATLDWARARGSLARGEAAEGIWTFKRAGFLRPRVTVRIEGDEAELAILSLSRGRESQLEFADGRRFTWGAARARRRWMVFADKTGKTVLSLLPRTRRFQYQADVEIGPGQRKLAELSLLALLGWYRLVLQSEEDAALAASVWTASQP